MSKFKLVMLSVLVGFFVCSGVASAGIIQDAYLISDTRDGQWLLRAGAFLNTAPGSNPSVNILGVDYTIPPDSWTGPGEYWTTLPTNPPDSVNGGIVSFTVDGKTVSGRLPSDAIDGYPGIFEVPYSIFNGFTGGTWENPILSWSNPFNTYSPEGIYLHQYAIRVFEKGVDGFLIDHRIRSGLENESHNFDFGTVAFEFDPAKEYGIRIEARRYHDFLDVNDPDLILTDWLGVINRNVITLDYAAPVPVPSTIVLLGIGLLGFAGVSRRKS